MKKSMRIVISITISLCMIMCGLCFTEDNSYKVLAFDEIIRNDMTGIPDAHLYEVALETADANEDGVLTVTEAELVTDFDGYNKGITNLKGMEYFKNLEYLSLGRNEINDIEPLKNLLKLRRLHLHTNKITNISYVTFFENLFLLDIQGNNVTDISPLKDLKNLKTLHLGKNNIEELSSLESLSHLSTLSINDNQISDISVVATLTALQGLTLSNNQITDISPINELTHLEKLILSNNQISDISSLNNINKLRWLDLQGNQISDISCLQSESDYIYINLNNNQISDISPLKGITAQITTLELSGNLISDISDITEIASNASVDLSNNNISVLPENLKESALMDYNIKNPFMDTEWEIYRFKPALLLKGNPITWEEAKDKLPDELLYAKSEENVMWSKMQGFEGYPTTVPVPEETPTPFPSVTPSVNPIGTKEPIITETPVVSEPVVTEEPMTSETVVSEVPSTSETPDVLLGDVDNDKKITLTDAQIVLRAALHIDVKVELSSEEFLVRADMDQNGKVELPDATMVLKYALKILPEDETQQDSIPDMDDMVGIEKTFTVSSVREYNGNITLLLKDDDEMLFELSVTEEIVITKNDQEVSVDVIVAGARISVDYKLILETYPGRLQGTTYIKIHDPLLE